MKQLIIFYLFISACSLRGQDFSDSYRAKLNGFGIPSERLNTWYLEVETNFNSILKLVKSVKDKKLGVLF